MRYRLMSILLVIAVAVITAPQAVQQLHNLRAIVQDQAIINSESDPTTVYAQEKRPEDYDLPVRDEMRQSYELSSGATVKVSGLNGPVDIETSNSGTAEVHIVRSARTREELDRRKIIVEHTPTSLVVRGDNQRGEGSRGEVRERVRLKVPRHIDLIASGMNGYVNVGEIDGPVKLSGINGRVEVARATGYTDISGVNGRVTVTLARLNERGISVSGINGGVELRFVEELNADIHASGINGSVDADMPNMTVEGRMSRSNFRARIGAGGTPIKVSGVNGRVRLAKA